MASTSYNPQQLSPALLNGHIYTQTQQLGFLWMVDFDCIDLNSGIVSPIFNYYADHSCYIDIRPVEQNYLSFVIILRSGLVARPPKVLVEISIKNATKDEKSVHSDTPVYSKKDCLEYYEFSKLVKIDQVFNEKGFLIDGNLLVMFKVTHASGIVDRPEAKKEKKSLDLTELFDSGRFSDVKFVVENKEFLLHKCILATQSRVFSAMFEHNMRENRENVVKIDDFCYDVMKELFRFIYTQKVENLEILASDLLAASNKYELDDLKNTCEKVLIRNLSIENVIDYFVLADHHQAHELRNSVNQFFLTNTKAVLSSDKFKSRLSSLPRVMIQDIFSLLVRKL